MKNGINLTKERIATCCVCCGNPTLKKTPAILMPFVAHRVFGWEPIEINESWELKTIQNGVAYAPCNSMFCNNCDFLFLDIRFSDKELSLLYAGYREEEYTELREKYEPGYAQKNNILVAGSNYVNQVESFLEPMLNFPVNILDWGGDTGKNTPFKHKSKLHHIYEISEKMPIAGAFFVDKSMALSINYDLIVCSNVIEHVPYPSDLLLEIKQVMHKETILYIEVPYEKIMQTVNENDLTLLKKRHWHEHINFYSEKALNNLLSACGFKVISSQVLNLENGGDSGCFFQFSCQVI